MRIRSEFTGGDRRFLWDNENALQTHAADGSLSEFFTDYPGYWGGMASSRNVVGAASSFMAFDPSGNMADYLNSGQVITATGRYTAFGQILGSQVIFGFGGQYGYYTDEATRLYVRARQYRPDMARWMSRDPIGFAGGDWNLYGYVGNGPIFHNDPSGLQAVKPISVWDDIVVPFCKIFGTVLSPLPSLCRHPSGRDLTCHEICAKFMALPKSDTSGGGGVVCCGPMPCPCVFGEPKQKPPWILKECPQVDACAAKHEAEHVVNPSGQCKPNDGLHRRPVTDKFFHNDEECRLRKKSIECLRSSRGKASPKCQGVSDALQASLQRYVDRSCGNIKI